MSLCHSYHLVHCHKNADRCKLPLHTEGYHWKSSLFFLLASRSKVLHLHLPSSATYVQMCTLYCITHTPGHSAPACVSQSPCNSLSCSANFNLLSVRLYKQVMLKTDNTSKRDMLRYYRVQESHYKIESC